MAGSGALPPIPAIGTGIAKARAAVAWRAAAVVGVLALLVVLAVLLADILGNNASLDEKRWFGHVAALAGMLLISAIVALVHAAAVRQAIGSQRAAATAAEPLATSTVSPPGILIGADNRLSTSKPPRHYGRRTRRLSPAWTGTARFLPLRWTWILPRVTRNSVPSQRSSVSHFVPSLIAFPYRPRVR